MSLSHLVIILLLALLVGISCIILYILLNILTILERNNNSMNESDTIPQQLEAKLSNLGRAKDSNTNIDQVINSKLASSSDKVWEEDGLSEEELEAWSQN